MASNDDAMMDGDGNSSDWIEIHNPTDDVVSLDGWHLTDDVEEPTKWSFPDRQIEAGEYLVVFASGQSNDRYLDAEGNLHTNFRLKRAGEYLAITHVDAEFNLVVATELSPQFPPQFEDVSYGAGVSFDSRAGWFCSTG